MPNQPSETAVVSDKEIALATAIKTLDHNDLHAYRYFVKHNQAPLAVDVSDRMFQLYLQGSSCSDIRRANPGFALGQIVACRVQHAWDIRREEYRRNLVTQVPARAQQVHLEQVDFLSDLLTISRVAIQNKIQTAMASGDPKDLEGIPIPRNVRDLGSLLDMFIRSTGQDKKRIEVSGNVTIDGKTGVATAITPQVAEDIMDRLLEDEVDDVKVVPPQKNDAIKVPKTHDEMVRFLMGTGVSEEKAEALVQSMDNDVRKYADLVEELLDKKIEDLN